MARNKHSTQDYKIYVLADDGSDKSSGHGLVKADIYFVALGMIDIPIKQEILTLTEEIREKLQGFRFIA